MTDDDEHSSLGTLNDRWPGPSANRVTFRGTLAEWSLDAVGWVAAYLAEAACRHGVDTPVTLTLRPAG